MVPEPFKKYDGKYSHSTFSMPKTITQYRPDDQNKDERKATEITVRF